MYNFQTVVMICWRISAEDVSFYSVSTSPEGIFSRVVEIVRLVELIERPTAVACAARAVRTCLNCHLFTISLLERTTTTTDDRKMAHSLSLFQMLIIDLDVFDNRLPSNAMRCVGEELGTCFD